MLGTYGLFLNVMAAPIVLLWDKTGVETFELPSHSKASMLMLNAGFDSIYNVLLLFGILITSPLFISVGSMLVMPASIVTDRLIHGTVMGPVGVCGAIVIVIGFSLLNIPQEDASRWMKRKCGRNRGGQDPLLTYAEF